MKSVLVIGAAGFVGPYLVDNLRKHKYKVIPTKLSNQKVKNKTYINLNILNKEEIDNVLKKYKPNYIVNLAAQSSVAVSWKNPTLTFNINVVGSLNILESIKELKLKTRLLLVGTSEEYGHQDKMPIKENAVCRPNNFYAISKLTQENIAQIYVKNYGLDIIFTRSFNHIGPGQPLGFVVPDFCKQIIDIKKGFKKPFLYVGNLKAKRDFSDVRDVVETYRLLLEKGAVGEIYNVGSGKAIQVAKILHRLIFLSKKNIKISISEDKYRPMDIPIIVSDVSKVRQVTGYAFKYDVLKELGKILKSYEKQA